MLTFVCIAHIVSHDHASRVTHLAQVRWEENVVDNEHLGQPPHPSPQLSRHVLVEFGPGARAKAFCCQPMPTCTKLILMRLLLPTTRAKLMLMRFGAGRHKSKKCCIFTKRRCACVRVCVCACVCVRILRRVLTTSPAPPLIQSLRREFYRSRTPPPPTSLLYACDARGTLL